MASVVIDLGYERHTPGSPPARFLASVDGLGNMPSNRRAVPRQSGKTLPDRLLCAVICGDIHTIGLKRASDGLFTDAGERNRPAPSTEGEQASALAGVIRRAPTGQTVRRCHPGVSALPCISPMTPGTTTGPTGVSVGASPEVLPSTRRNQ